MSVRLDDTCQLGDVGRVRPALRAATTIASQGHGNLVGRLVKMADIACSVTHGLGDVFRMAMQPEFHDSIINEVMDSVRGCMKYKLPLYMLISHNNHVFYISTHSIIYIPLFILF